MSPVDFRFFNKFYQHLETRSLKGDAFRDTLGYMKILVDKMNKLYDVNLGYDYKSESHTLKRFFCDALICKESEYKKFVSNLSEVVDFMDKNVRAPIRSSLKESLEKDLGTIIRHIKIKTLADLRSPVKDNS